MGSDAKRTLTVNLSGMFNRFRQNIPSFSVNIFLVRYFIHIVMRYFFVRKKMNLICYFHYMQNISLKRITIKKIVNTNVQIQEKIEDDPNGKSVALNDIPYGKLAARTVANYTNIIRNVTRELFSSNILVGTPDLTRFYWEKFGDDAVIRTILKILHTKYTIRNGDELATKMSPIVSCLVLIGDIIPSEYLAKWTSLVAHYRRSEDDYKLLLNELNIIRSVTTTESKPIPDWLTIRQQMHNISVDSTQDARLRVLCTIYKFGYVLRIGSIFRTRIRNDNDTTNFLNLTTCEWIIIKSKRRVQMFKVNSQLCAELTAIIASEDFYFSKGWLLPKANGLSYSESASIASFTPWKSTDLPNNVDCRKSFESWHWYAAGQSAAAVSNMSVILDHRPSTAIIHYTPPYDLHISDE